SGALCRSVVSRDAAGHRAGLQSAALPGSRRLGHHRAIPALRRPTVGPPRRHDCSGAAGAGAVFLTGVERLVLESCLCGVVPNRARSACGLERLRAVSVLALILLSETTAAS